MTDSSAPSANRPSSDGDGRDLLGDRYRLVRRLATGGMAEVWEAVDEVLARTVAVKMLQPSMAADDAVVARFRHEAIAAARLAHPNIVSIFDTVSGPSGEAIVMELVRGRTLREELDDRGYLPIDESSHILTEVAGAIAAAHRAGIVHRDVKPGNILLADDGRVLVTDFGIAKAIESEADLTLEGTMVGTAKYLAPEQVRGEPADERSDVYSLGVVLFETLCGSPPFDAEDAVATAVARLHRDPPRPRRLRAGIPVGLEQIILTAMARQADARYRDAEAFRTAVLGRHSPSPASPPTGRGSLLDTADPDATIIETAPSFVESERAWLLPTLVVLLIGAALATAGALLGQTDVGQGIIRRVDEAIGDPGPSEAEPIVIEAVRSFDPGGDQREHDGEVQRAIDGDLDTAWTTESYDTRNFAGLKKGVGLILVLEDSHRLDHLRVRTAADGWAASIFVADRSRSSLDGWGAAVASEQSLDQDVTFSLDGAVGSTVLLWITDLGDGPRRVSLGIGEVEIQGTQQSDPR